MNSGPSALEAAVPGDLAELAPELLAAKSAVERSLRATSALRVGAVAPNAVSGPTNIQGVAVGLGQWSGTSEQPGSIRPPGDPVLTLYLTEAAPPATVRSVMVNEMGVQAAGAEEGVPVHPVVTGYIDAQPHRVRLRPAPGGDSIGHYKITAGTLGCLAVGRSAPRSGKLFILSNNHVLANVNDAAIGDSICQPGPYDGGTRPADEIAQLEQFIPLQFGGHANFVDCATAWAWPDRVRSDLMQISNGQTYYYRASGEPVEATLGLSVGKAGRTTQVTSGRVTGLSASVWVNYDAGRSAYFEDQIAIQGFGGDFSAGGDSGSLIWTWDARRSPVGLLYAGGGGVTFANRLARVLPALDINLYL